MEVEEKPKKLGTAKRKRMKAVQAKIREQVISLLWWNHWFPHKIFILTMIPPQKGIIKKKTQSIHKRMFKL